MSLRQSFVSPKTRRQENPHNKQRHSPIDVVIAHTSDKQNLETKNHQKSGAAITVAMVMAIVPTAGLGITAGRTHRYYHSYLHRHIDTDAFPPTPSSANGHRIAASRFSSSASSSALISSASITTRAAVNTTAYHRQGDKQASHVIICIDTSKRPSMLHNVAHNFLDTFIRRKTSLSCLTLRPCHAPTADIAPKQAPSQCSRPHRPRVTLWPTPRPTASSSIRRRPPSA